MTPDCECFCFRFPFRRGVLLIDAPNGACRHTSGRGGYGNTSSAAGTGGYDTQAPHHDTSELGTYATGRGGAGNIQGGNIQGGY